MIVLIIRINNGDYCTIIIMKFIIHGGRQMLNQQLFLHLSLDTLMNKEMKIMNNLVYNNVNKIPYYNSSYACTGTSTYGCQLKLYY